MWAEWAAAGCQGSGPRPGCTGSQGSGQSPPCGLGVGSQALFLFSRIFFSFTLTFFSRQKQTRRATDRKGSGVGVPVQERMLVSCWTALDQVWEPADHRPCLVAQVTQSLELLVEEEVFGLASTGLL